ERLRITWDIDETTLDAVEAAHAVAGLVENAIKHGLEAYSQAGRIAITSCRRGGELWLSIRDDGPGPLGRSPTRGSGMGLRNVRSRPQQLYGERESLLLEPAAGGGTEVTVLLPLRAGASINVGYGAEGIGGRAATRRQMDQRKQPAARPAN
ncbi:MAG: hypothetical protein B7Z74_08405, partial [Deltaproteobacteria bacterium 21-66-5]